MITKLNIEISDKCNLNCIHCYYSSKIRNFEMEYDNIEYILRRYPNLEQVIFTGGEPLTHSSIHRILDLCMKYINVQFIITTNGLLIDELILQKYKSIGNIYFQISLESTDSTVNNYIRRGTPENIALSNAQELAEIDPRRITLRMTINSLNYMDVENFYNLCRGLKILPSYMFIAKSGNADLNWDKLKLDAKQKMYAYSTIKTLYMRDNISGSPPSEVRGCNLKCNYSITTEGNIYICSYFPNTFIGNIFIHTDDEIAANYKHLPLLTECLTWKKKVLETHCKECVINSVCQQGCYGKYIVNNKGIDGIYHDNGCEFRILRYTYNCLKARGEMDD